MQDYPICSYAFGIQCNALIKTRGSNNDRKKDKMPRTKLLVGDNPDSGMNTHSAGEFSGTSFTHGNCISMVSTG